MKGTRDRNWFWRTFGNQNAVPYNVPETVIATVDATKQYPIPYKYAQNSTSQGLAGPANATTTIGPPAGKAWLIDYMSALVNPTRVGYLHYVLKFGTAAGFGAGARVALARWHMGFMPSNTDIPLGMTPAGAAGAGNAMGPCQPLGLYLRGLALAETGTQIFGDVLEITMEAAVMGDVFETRYRYMEFDLDSPPGA